MAPSLLLKPDDSELTKNLKPLIHCVSMKCDLLNVYTTVCLKVPSNFNYSVILLYVNVLSIT